MSQRLDFATLSPQLAKKYYEFSMAVKASGLSPTILHLVDLRASQINGCAFCVDMHVKEAKIAGDRHGIVMASASGQHDLNACFIGRAQGG